jgi:hypothetical protein
MYLGSHDHKGQLRIGRRQGGGADWGLDLEIGYLLATGAYSETPNLATPDFSSSSFQPMAGSTYLEVPVPRCILKNVLYRCHFIVSQYKNSWVWEAPTVLK